MSAIWLQYSKKLLRRLDKPQFLGHFSDIEAHKKGMRHVVGHVKNGVLELTLDWLVDESDGIIADAKYQLFGPTGLMGAAEVASEAVMRKTYEQASRITADLLDRMMRDYFNRPAFPDACASFLNMAIDAIDLGVQQCLDIPCKDHFDTTPFDENLEIIPGGLPGWQEMPDLQKRKIIEEVIEREIRPYIVLDAGDIHVLGVRGGKEVQISYEGACASCFAATGSTLSAIQRILQARVHPSITVAYDPIP